MRRSDSSVQSFPPRRHTHTPIRANRDGVAFPHPHPCMPAFWLRIGPMLIAHMHPRANFNMAPSRFHFEPTMSTHVRHDIQTSRSVLEQTCLTHCTTLSLRPPSLSASLEIIGRRQYSRLSSFEDFPTVHGIRTFNLLIGAFNSVTVSRLHVR